MKQFTVSLLMTTLVLGFAFLGSAHDRRAFRANLKGFKEVPSVSTAGKGSFKARLSRDGSSFEYKMKVKDVSSSVTQAHLHFGRSKTNGGAAAFLCQTDSRPDPTGLAPMCVDEGEISGVISADNVIGPAGQGIAPGEFRELVRAMRANAVYVNVHTVDFGPGELRGQVKQD